MVAIGDRYSIDYPPEGLDVIHLDHDTFKKLTPAQRTAIIALCDVPLEEFGTTDFVGVVKRVLDNRWQSWYHSGVREEQLRKETVARVQRRQREAELAEERETWARNNVHAGMIIKVRGTRDGHGMRIVSRVDDNQLVCQQLQTVPYNKSRKDVIKVFGPQDRVISYVLANQITTHGYDKVMAWGDETVNIEGETRYRMKKVP